MKIALCFSGQPRFVAECAQSIKTHLMAGHEVDVFAHLWWDKAYIGEIFRFHCFDQYESDMKSVFLDQYRDRLKCGIFEPQKQFDITLPSEEGAWGKTLKSVWKKEVRFKQLSMFYSLKQVQTLLDNYIESTQNKYDMFVRCRTDIMFTKSIDFARCNEDKLYFDTFGSNGIGIEDYFVCSPNHRNLKVFQTMYDTMPLLLNGMKP